jgi:TolA-binding protein
MSIQCDAFKDAVMDLIYGELSEEAAEALRAHAAKCPSCARMTEELLLTRKMTSTLLSLSPPAAMDATILGAAKAYCDGVTADVAEVTSSKASEKLEALFQKIRAMLLSPAFAAAAVAGVVLVTTALFVDLTPTPEQSKDSVISVMEEKPAPKVEEPELSLNEAPSATALSSRTTPSELLDEKVPDQLSDAVDNVVHSRVKSKSKGGSRAQSADNGATATGVKRLTRDSGRRSATAPKSSLRKSAPQLDDLLFAAPPPEKKKMKPARPKAADEAVDMEMEREEAPALSDLGSQAEVVDDFVSKPEGKAAASAASSGRSTTARPSGDAYRRGMDAVARGDCGEAIAALETVVRSPKSYPGKQASAMHHIARCEKRQGRCSRALYWFEKIFVSHPDYVGRPKALLEAAQCRRRLGQIQQARELLERLERIPGWSDTARQQLDTLNGSQ